jgi:hypothetical protein
MKNYFLLLSKSDKHSDDVGICFSGGFFRITWITSYSMPNLKIGVFLTNRSEFFFTENWSLRVNCMIFWTLNIFLANMI